MCEDNYTTQNNVNNNATDIVLYNRYNKCPACEYNKLS